MGFLALLIAVVLGSVGLSYSQHLSLSSSSTNRSYCPGTIYLTCNGKGIPVFIDWIIDGTCAGTYSFNDDDTYPQSFLSCPRSSLHPGVELVVLSASSPPGDVFTMNIMAVLQGNLTRLRGSTIQCQSNSFQSESISVKARVPVVPTDVVVLTMHDIDSLLLSRVDLQWSVPDSECPQVTYTVTLVNASGGIEDQQMVLCGNGTLCTTSFTPPSSNQTYNVRIIATNNFDESSVSAWLSGPIAGLTAVNHSLTFENCFTNVCCYSPKDEGECSVRYGLDSYNRDPTITGSLNSNFTLPFTKPMALYYYQINVTSNYTVQFQGNFTTGEFDVRWTSANTVLSVVGALLLTASLLFGLFAILICYLKQVKRGIQNPSTICPRHVTFCHHCRLIFIAVCAGAILAFISLALWIATRIIVDKEDNTCDPAWKSDRDGLIIAAMVISLFTFLLMVVVPVAIAIFNIGICRTFIYRRVNGKNILEIHMIQKSSME